MTGGMAQGAVRGLQRAPWLSHEGGGNPARLCPTPGHSDVRRAHALLRAEHARLGWPRSSRVVARANADSSGRPAPGSAPRAKLLRSHRCSGARGVGLRVDVTTPESAELGLHVARVVAPELCALDVVTSPDSSAAGASTTAAARLGSSRAARAPRSQPDCPTRSRDRRRSRRARCSELITAARAPAGRPDRDLPRGIAAYPGVARTRWCGVPSCSSGATSCAPRRARSVKRHRGSRRVSCRRPSSPASPWRTPSRAGGRCGRTVRAARARELATLLGGLRRDGERRGRRANGAYRPLRRRALPARALRATRRVEGLDGPSTTTTRSDTCSRCWSRSTSRVPSGT